MVDSVHSGYKEEAQTVGWTGATRELASLAADEYTDLSDEIDNSSAKHLFADFQFEAGDPAATFAGQSFSLFLIPSIDGTNYPNWTGDGTTDEPSNDQYFVGSFTMDNGDPGAVSYYALRNVAIPPGKFKVACRNGPDEALPATNNALKYRRWNYASQ